jgi:diadenosine tetraphosphatase ApaH/serine/threonine PP2A family protein phosphatase
MQQNWVQILGNHDRALVAEDPGSHGKSDAYACQQLDAQQKEWLHRLPTSATIHDKVLLFHGAPADDLQYLLETIEQGRLRLASRSEISTRLRGTRAPVMICGHSHVQRMIELADGSVIVNPGSVGLPAYEDNGPQPHIVESGSPYARYAIVEVAGKTCGVEFITVPYDSRSAAGQARRNDRPEWGIALETGFMKT